MNIWDFFNQHWFLAFIAIMTAGGLVRRFMRLIMVLFRGWPNAHLMNADGDIVHPDKE